MNRVLDQKIEEAAEKVGVGPEDAVVAIDMSNVVNWSAPGDFEPANENRTKSYRVSVPKMSSYFKSLSTNPLIRVFSPHVYLSNDLIKEITVWVMANCPEILNSSEFIPANLTNSNFNTKLAKAIRGFMAENGDKLTISADVRAKLSTLTRAETWFSHKERFEASGFEVIGKALNFRSKTLVEDKTHISAVTNVLQVVDDVQRDVEEMNEFMDDMRNGREGLQEMAKDLEIAGSIFDRVSQSLTMDEKADLYVMISQFRAKLSQIGRSAEQIKDQIIHAPSKKCDLDVDIVAATLDPETLRKYGVFVFYSGDGDFKRMYQILNREGKKVVVASPDGYLAKSIKEMAARGEVTLHKPNFQDNIWREIQINQADKKPA